MHPLRPYRSHMFFCRTLTRECVSHPQKAFQAKELLRLLYSHDDQNGWTLKRTRNTDFVQLGLRIFFFFDTRCRCGVSVYLCVSASCVLCPLCSVAFRTASYSSISLLSLRSVVLSPVPYLPLSPADDTPVKLPDCCLSDFNRVELVREPHIADGYATSLQFSPDGRICVLDFSHLSFSFLARLFVVAVSLLAARGENKKWKKKKNRGASV